MDFLKLDVMWVRSVIGEGTSTLETWLYLAKDPSIAFNDLVMLTPDPAFNVPFQRKPAIEKNDADIGLT